MRKQKSVFAVLLAIMMVFTFMPTMAFAADQQPADSTVKGAHTWKAVESKSKAATCTEAGYTFYECTEDGCNVTYAEVVSALGHTGDGAYHQYKVAEYLETRAAEGATESAITAEAKALAGKCYVYADACKNCGKLMAYQKSGTYAPQGHTNNGEACAESFECAFCGQTVKNTNATGHTITEWKTVAEHVCPATTDTNGATGGLDKQEGKCEKCGEVKTRYVASDNWSRGSRRVAKGTDISTLTDKDREEFLKHGCSHSVTPMTDAEIAAEKIDTSNLPAGYIAFAGKVYKTTVKTAATCAAEGVEVLACPECGFELVSKPIAKTSDHAWTTLTTPATCTDREKSIKICSVCGIKGTTTYGADALGHDYKVTVVSEPNCEYDGLTLIECTRCGTSETAAASKHIEEKNKVKYFKGFDNKLYDSSATAPYAKCIEIADWAHGAHKWGAFEDYKIADCVTAPTQARKCSVCGSFNHADQKTVGKALGHTAVVTVNKATCGEGGYTESRCSVCGKSLDKDGKSRDQYDDDYDFVDEWDTTKPVVAYGTKCNYDWKVLEEATPFKLGTKAKVCSVCGDVEWATKESVAKTAVAKPGVKVYKGKKKATVNVKAATDAVSYKILVNGKVSKTVTKAGKVTVTKGLKLGKKNTFQIKAYDANKNVAKSGKVTKFIKKK